MIIYWLKSYYALAALDHYRCTYSKTLIRPTCGLAQQLFSAVLIPSTGSATVTETSAPNLCYRYIIFLIDGSLVLRWPTPVG